jgi:sugar phosphate isomerase/epimerase
MKLAFSTNAFKKYSLQDSIRKISTIGYEGVEILADIPHTYPPMFGKEQIGSAIDTLSECDIQVSNLSAFTLYAITDVYHPSWIDDNTDVALRMDVPQMSHVIYPLTSCIGEYTLGAKAFCGVLKMSRRCCENILDVLGSKL